MKFRKAIPQDAPLLSDLAFRSKSFWPYDKEALENYRSELTLQPEELRDDFAYIGLQDQKITGFYVLSAGPNTQRLHFLFVEPEFIGKGYGLRLWQHAISKAKEKNWKSLTLYADNFAIKKFYKHQNFKVIGQLSSSLGILHELNFDLTQQS